MRSIRENPQIRPENRAKWMFLTGFWLFGPHFRKKCDVLAHFLRKIAFYWLFRRFFGFFPISLDVPGAKRMLSSVSMNRTVQRSAVEPQARSFAGLSLSAPPNPSPLLESAALTPSLWTDAAPAATSSARASFLAV